MLSVNAATLVDAAIDAVGRADSPCSEVGVNDPRLIEQPQSVIAINAIEQDARGSQREIPEKEKRTGMTIDVKDPRELPLLVARRAANSSPQNANADLKARVVG